LFAAVALHASLLLTANHCYSKTCIVVSLFLFPPEMFIVVCLCVRCPKVYTVYKHSYMMIRLVKLCLFLAALLLLLHTFNGLFSRTTWASWHQKGKPFWILLEQEMMGWQWHQLDHTQIICTLLKTDNYASNPPLSFYKPYALPAANQQHQSTEGIKYQSGDRLTQV